MAAKRSRKTIFLSHSVTDRTYALGLREVLEEAFAGKVTCVLSAHMGQGTAPGTQWFDKTRAAINKSDLALVLCSRRSIHRPWVSFEAGAACFGGVSLTVLCMGGLSRNELPPPLSALPVADASRLDDCHQFLQSLATALGVALPAESTLPERLFRVFTTALPGEPALADPTVVETEEERPLTSMEQERFLFWREFITRGRRSSVLPSRIRPHRENWVSMDTGKEGIHYTCLIWPSSVAVDLSIDMGKGRMVETKQLFEDLYRRRSEVETEFGGPLEWDPNPDRRSCRVRHLIEQGGLSNRERWEEIQESMIDALTRLERVVSNCL